VDEMRALFYCIANLSLTVMYPQRGVWCQKRHTPFLLAYFALLHSAAYHSQIKRSLEKQLLYAAHHLSDYPPRSVTAGTSSPNSLTAFSAITPLMPSSSPLKTSLMASTLVFTLGHSLSSSSTPNGGKKG